MAKRNLSQDDKTWKKANRKEDNLMFFIFMSLFIPAYFVVSVVTNDWGYLSAIYAGAIVFVLFTAGMIASMKFRR